MFTETGIPIEPFNIQNDVKSGLLTEDGFLKRSLQEQREKDPWLDSIEAD